MFSFTSPSSSYIPLLRGNYVISPVCIYWDNFCIYMCIYVPISHFKKLNQATDIILQLALSLSGDCSILIWRDPHILLNTA